MKVQVLSDLHLEFGNFINPLEDRDLLIIAGDLHVGSKGLEFIKQELKKSPIIYVLGNHEFYHYQFQEITKFWTSCDLEGLYVLENSQVELEGWKFLGATLWTNLSNLNKKV